MEFTGISMIDQTIIQHLQEKIKNGLPGRPAQERMAPAVRFNGRIWPDPALSRDSSVLISLFQDKGMWTTLFIERTPYGPHGGQISFPGGKRDPDDQSLMDTALREAHEEVGLDPSRVHVIGELSRLYVPNSNFWIHPFVGLIDHPETWTCNPLEVIQVIPVPLDDLFNQQNKLTKDFRRNDVHIHAPCYAINGFHIWGATAMIISELEVLLS